MPGKRKIDSDDFGRLRSAMERDYRALAPFRENMRDHVEQYAGGAYGIREDMQFDNSTQRLPLSYEERQKPVNNMALFVKTMGGYLVGADPRMMSSADDPKVKPLVAAMETWGNRKLQSMYFSDTIADSTLSAFFLMGIVRVALTAPAESRFAGYDKPAQMRVSNIQFEDFGFDTRAKRFEECEYMWHKYRVLHDDVKNSTLFPAKLRKNITPDRAQLVNESGDESILSISRQNLGNEEYREYNELVEVYFPREKRVLTFEWDRPEGILLDQEWVGPDCGPYHLLYFFRVPGQVVPKGPIMDLANLDRSSNKLWRKLDYQASRQKNYTVYQDADQAEKVKNTPDGGWVQSSSGPSAVEEKSTQGPNQVTAIWLDKSMQMFDKQAGGLSILGGLQSMADTATQEKLLSGNASTLVQSMQRSILQHAQSIMRAMAWFWWHDPDATITSTVQAPGVPEVSTERNVTPLDRLGVPFEQIDFRIDPYSLTYETPQVRIQKIDEMVKNVYLPLLPQLGMPGVAEFLETYTKMKAKYTNNPDLLELFEALTGSQGMSQPEADTQDQGMPNETTRNYVRTSRPGMTDRGDEQKVRQMMAAGPNGSPDQFAQAMAG